MFWHRHFGVRDRIKGRVSHTNYSLRLIVVHHKINGVTIQSCLFPFNLRRTLISIEGFLRYHSEVPTCLKVLLFLPLVRCVSVVLYLFPSFCHPGRTCFQCTRPYRSHVPQTTPTVLCQPFRPYPVQRFVHPNVSKLCFWYSYSRTVTPKNPSLYYFGSR